MSRALALLRYRRVRRSIVGGGDRQFSAPEGRAGT
jgi:hypothetical protein